MLNSPQYKNNRLLNVLHHKPVDRTPVWIMRQAGRYLPEYRATRAKVGSFMSLCKTPEFACEVTLQPLRRYPLDAAILFSDILTIPDAMGLELNFIEGKGPHFSFSLRHEKEILRVNLPNFENLQYVYQTIKLIKKELNQQLPLIGFCGSPWTLAAYMIQGHSEPGFPQAMQMRDSQPHLLHHLLNILAYSVSTHLKNQIIAGADVVMLFDTWGGLLNTEDYLHYSLKYIQQIIKDLRSDPVCAKIPIILFTKTGHRWLELMAETGCDALGVDWEISLQEARQRVGDRVVLQGNLHPEVLLKSESTIRNEVKKVLDSFGEGNGHIFNLGHGITPDVPPENVSILVDAVHELSEKAAR